MSFGFYSFGTVLLLAGVMYICHLAQLPQRWSIGVLVLLLGAGIVEAANATRQRNPG